MAQHSYINFSYLNKTSGLSYRFLQDGLAKYLHNTRNTSGLLPETTGKPKGELFGKGDMGAKSNSKLLKQIPRYTSSVIENKISGMSDPNVSMWIACKEHKRFDGSGKKLKTKFKRLRENIKQYYVNRLEENQILFTENEEPFKISKLEKKDRTTKFRDWREEFESFTAEAVHPLNMRSAAREQQLNINEKKLREMDVQNSDDYHNDVLAEVQLKKGYKHFNRLVDKEVGVDVKQNLTSSTDKMRGQELEEDPLKIGRMFIEQDGTTAPALKEKPIINRDIIDPDDNGQEGASEVRGVAPAVHFKITWVGLNNHDFLLDSNNSLLGCSKNILRCSSTSRVPSCFLSTSSMWRNNDDTCKPKTMPPKNVICNPDKKLLKCPKSEKQEWPCCPKITVCGCDPPNPRIFDNCGRDSMTAVFPFSKRADYICPAFSECRRSTETIKKPTKECCGYKKVCDKLVGPRKPFVTAEERQEISLGQKFFTGQKNRKCSYHRSARLMEEESCEDKGALPCHKPVGKKVDKLPSGGSCEKICMPCCEKAKVPPLCDASSTFQKAPCTKVDNPRPSFAECQKKFAMKHVMCECEVPIKPRCPGKKTKEGSC